MSLGSELFPHIRYKAYLNHASLTPPSTRVMTAMQEMAAAYARSGVNAWRDGAACRNRLREKLARFTGGQPRDYGLIQNTSHGLTIVAHEYPWQPGDSLVLFHGEFPGNVIPWLAAARQYGLDVIWLHINDLAGNTEAFRDAMARKPRLLALSWVQYQTGLTLDIAMLSKLREHYDVHICLDAIQGLGALTMNLEKTPFDFVVCGGHKWLMGPEGTGFIYVHPQRMDQMRPVLPGWLSQEQPATFLYMGGNHVDYHRPIRKDASRYEMATVNNIGYAGLEAGIDLFLEQGPTAVSSRILDLAARVRNGLKAMGIVPATNGTAAGIVSFSLPDRQLLAWFRHLEEAGIALATPDGYLRASPHFTNDKSHVDLYLEKLKQLIKSGQTS